MAGLEAISQLEAHRPGGHSSPAHATPSLWQASVQETVGEAMPHFVAGNSRYTGNGAQDTPGSEERISDEIAYTRDIGIASVATMLLFELTKQHGKEHNTAED